MKCQDIIRSKNTIKRAEIPLNDSTGKFNTDILMQSSTKQDYLLWSLLRQINTANNLQTEFIHDAFVPSLIATKSLLEQTNKHLTLVAFTPIIPSPATEADTIYTCMKNFQDVLIQKNLEYGPLWSDEGVYRTAKELQLLRRHSPFGITFCKIK